MNVVNELAKNRVVENMINDMNILDYPEDLAQDIYMVLLEYDQDKLSDIYNKKQINFFISRIIMNQAFSKNSPFHYKYRKWDENKVDFDFEYDKE